MNRLLTIALFLCLLPALAAFGKTFKEPKHDPLIDGLMQYAEMSAVLSHCDEGPGLDGVNALAARIAALRMPGWGNYLFGYRSSFQEEISQAARTTFYIGRPDMDCNWGPARMTAKHVVDLIESMAPAS